MSYIILSAIGLITSLAIALKVAIWRNKRAEKRRMEAEETAELAQKAIDNKLMQDIALRTAKYSLEQKNREAQTKIDAGARDDFDAP